MQIAQHGVLMLSLFVFLQAIGLPVPCAIALILAARSQRCWRAMC
jgi:hypothetical protein